MLYTVRMVVGEDIMDVAHTNSAIEAELILATLKDDGKEAWVCDILQEILVG